MDRLSYQTAVRSHHETPHFSINIHISHTRRNQDIIVNFLHAGTDDTDIIGCLLRPVGNSHTAGQIDKVHFHSCFLFDFHAKFKQGLCQCRIIIVGHCIGYQERMDAETLHTLFL